MKKIGTTSPWFVKKDVDGFFGLGLFRLDTKRGDELPEGLRRREDRLRAIQEAKKRLEARQAEEDRKKGRSPDDGRKSPRGGRRRDDPALEQQLGCSSCIEDDAARVDGQLVGGRGTARVHQSVPDQVGRHRVEGPPTEATRHPNTRERAVAGGLEHRGILPRPRRRQAPSRWGDGCKRIRREPRAER